MPLIEELESNGQWLFRWRSYLPLLLLAVALPSLASFVYPLQSHLLDTLWEAFCLAVAASGLVLRALTIGSSAPGTSGRNTTEQVAENLNTTGLYSIVRNPLYLGNYLMVLGILLFLRDWRLLLIYSLVFALYYERIILAEEAYLRKKFGDHYVKWASATPAFFPRFSQWKPSERPFSWRKMLRREYHGLLAVVAALVTLECAGDFFEVEAFHLDLFWALIVGLSLSLYGFLRFLHKHTDLLREQEYADGGREAVSNGPSADSPERRLGSREAQG